MHELLEREDKWDVNDHFVLPRLHDLIDGGQIDRSTVHLESAYYDTADHDLQSHGIVLRNGTATTTPAGSSRFRSPKVASRFVPRSRTRRPPSCKSC